MSGAICFFLGGTTAAYCERGCCGDACCSTTTTEGSSVGWALIGIIAALIGLFFIVIIIYCILQRKGYLQSRPDAEKTKPWRPPPPKAGKGKKNQAKKDPKQILKKNMIAMNAFNWANKKKKVQKDSKSTLTEDYNSMPGDFVRWSTGFWLPVKRDKNAPKLDMSKVRNIGVNTEAIRNNKKPINVEPKFNNNELDLIQKVVQKVNSSVTPRTLPPPTVVKPANVRGAPVPSRAAPAQHRAAPIPTHLQHNKADYSDVKLPYDYVPRQQEVTQSPREAILRPPADDGRVSSNKSVAFSDSPQPPISTPENPERQDTIELLNEFTKQMLGKK